MTGRNYYFVGDFRGNFCFEETDSMGISLVEKVRHDSWKSIIDKCDDKKFEVWNRFKKLWMEL